jgi:uncharacterized protein YbcI
MTERDERQLDPVAIAAAISEQLSAIHAETYDTPVTHAASYVHDDLVVALLDIELTVIEQRMIEFGHGNVVHELRHAVQHAEAANFEAVVERATGRLVVAFSSHTHLDPPFVTEIFRLGPSTAHPPEPQ